MTNCCVWVGDWMYKMNDNATKFACGGSRNLSLMDEPQH